jgi:hypothetical protein
MLRWPVSIREILLGDTSRWFAASSTVMPSAVRRARNIVPSSLRRAVGLPVAGTHVAPLSVTIVSVASARGAGTQRHADKIALVRVN